MEFLKNMQTNKQASRRDNMTKKQLNAFKEGATDALLEGYKSDWHENLYYYQEGYRFGLYLYNQQDPNENK